VIVKATPAIVMVAALELAAVFGVTKKFSVPVPDPDGLEVIATQGTLLAAVQAHPLSLTTPIVLAPPVEEKTRLAGERL
jgi:hypothetical protein